MMLIILGILVLAMIVAVVIPLPGSEWRSGWRAKPLKLIEDRFGRRARGLVSKLPHPRRTRSPDPFEALRVQTRLGAVADEIRALEYDDAAFARAARLEARSAAYDALLREACELAGVSLEEECDREAQRIGREAERMRRELELAQRGWSW
jgi:hypothetical protein